VNAALLRGREHPEIGALAEVACDDTGAAISRGGAPKPYPHVDPNEDAALVARGTRGLLVAVADGHWGYRAAESVLEHLLAVHAEAWTEGAGRGLEAWREAALAALLEANELVIAGHDESERSRTTLSLGLVRPADGIVMLAAMGDSHVFRVGADGIVELERPRKPTFLGQRRLRASSLARTARVEVDLIGDLLALVAVTDGLSEPAIGVDDPAGAVREATRRGGGAGSGAPAAAAARGIVEASLAAHRAHRAGDNVAAAVAWLGPKA
jgi:hypothetical protein